MTNFDRKTAREYLKKHYPGCPRHHRENIAQRVKYRTWKNASLGKAVGIIVTSYIRHNLTHYEALMKHHGLTREEARIAEADAVADICRSWQEADGPADVPIVALRARIRPRNQSAES